MQTYKEVIFKDEARQRILSGINLVADAVKPTLGPHGRKVAIGYGQDKAPEFVDDGATIAKSIVVRDRFQNIGVRLARQVATKTEDEVGDGTTTTILMLQAIIAEGARAISEGVDPMILTKDIQEAVNDVVETLKGMAQPLKQKEIEKIATLAATDPKLGGVVAKAVQAVGEYGIITAEESHIVGIDFETVKGLEFDAGFVSPYMITDVERMEAVIKNAPVLVTEHKISSIKKLLPILESVAKEDKKEIVIFADELYGEALATIVANNMRGNFRTLAVNIPGIGERKRELLEDIAYLTGAQIISKDGHKLEEIPLTALGSADKIVSSAKKTLIAGGKGKKIEERIAQMKTQIENIEKSGDQVGAYLLARVKERMAKLAGGVGVVKIGAPTQAEMHHLKLKADDAILATRAAMAEGVVPGAGKAYLGAVEARSGTAGYRAVLKAVRYLRLQIEENAGGLGVNDTDIIDPVAVEISALKNSASAAIMFLTTEAAIEDETPRD